MRTAPEEAGGAQVPPPYQGDLDADTDYRLPPWPGDAKDWPGGLSPRKLLVAALALALICALAGGLLGGFVASRPTSATAPGYRLGAAPPAVTKRAAGSVAGIAARVLPSVVMVKVNGNAGTGSGFVIKGGYILTNNHVVTLDGHATGTSLEIVLQNGVTVPGRLVGRDIYSDLAVIKPVGVHGLRPLPLGNSGGVDVGDQVIAFGAPLGLAGTVTSGIVSALRRPVQPGAGNGPAAPQVFLDAIQTDAAINPGNSGGPLVNSQGQVVGVDSAFDTLGGNMLGQGGSIGLGFAIPINDARRVAQQLIQTGHASHAVLGASFSDSDQEAGARLTAGHRGSQELGPGPAARAGLRPGDVIVGFAGQSIPNAPTLLDAIRSQAPGSVVRVTYLRGGQTEVTHLRMGSAGA